MTKRIATYKDLLEEKERLRLLLSVQKEIIREDIHSIGHELEPVKKVVSLAGKLVTRDNSNLLLNAGTNKLIDLVVKKLILSKAGWLTRLTVPFLLKNYSSHFISENKGGMLKKLFSWIGKKNVNGHEKMHDN